VAKFEEGHKKTGGRKPNSPNKKTLETRALIQHVLDLNQEKLIQELSALDGKDFIQAYTNLFEYVVPKLARQEITGKDGESLTVIFQTAKPEDAQTDGAENKD
jgi:hypothetical protein